MYYIYKITNILNNKIYIGRTNDFKRRMREHKVQYNRSDRTNNSPLYIAMREEGIENFHEEIIKIVQTQEEADQFEEYYIDFYRNTLGINNVYNYQDGGVGGQSHNVDGENNPMYHKEVSFERRKQVSQKLKKRKKPNGFGEKVSQSLKGKKKSKEAVAKKSHPIKMINIHTQEVKEFPSKCEMERQLHTNTNTIVNGGTTKSGWKMYK